MNLLTYFALWIVLLCSDNHARKTRSKRYIEDHQHKYPKCNKYIVLAKRDGEIEDVNTECENYQRSKRDLVIYIPPESDQRETQNGTAKSFDVVTDTQNLELWKELGYGDLVMLDKTSLRYENSGFILNASTDMVPIWRTIAEGQLQIANDYVEGVRDTLIERFEWNVGLWDLDVSGILTLHNQTNKFNQGQEMYALDTENRQMDPVPIPKIIYRVINAHSCYAGEFNAVIIIHNDPTHVPDEDRICNEEGEISSWYRIKNENHTTGLTYVCQINGDIYSKLGTSGSWADPLELDEIPYSEHPSWPDTYPIVYHDIT